MTLGPRPIDMSRSGQAGAVPDRRTALLAAGLELSRRAQDAPSMEDLSYLLTNDLRAVVEFDRSFLLTHVDGASRVAAMGNQPLVEKKSKFFEELNLLAGRVKDLTKPLLLSKEQDLERLTADLLDPEVKKAVMGFLDFSGATGIFIVPLRSDNEVLAHLVFEFLADRMPDQAAVMSLINVAPFFGSAFAKRWVLSRSTQLVPLTRASSWKRRYLVERRLATLKLAAGIAGVILAVLFLLPIPFNVGGEAEVVPRHRHVAFCQVEGIVQEILIEEGSRVEKGQVVAVLDPIELNHKINMARRELDLLRNEAKILQRASFENNAKLAESHLSILKFKRAQAELEFLEWQQQFIQIKAPAEGVVVTKQVQALVGKKFTAGEPFCEIGTPGDLCAEIAVPEDRMAYVEKGQEAGLYLSSDPMRRYALKVTDLAPKAEAIPRLGNVYRVRGVFSGDAPRFSVGQKGTGSIDAGTKSLWFIVTQRVGARWNEFAQSVW